MEESGTDGSNERFDKLKKKQKLADDYEHALDGNATLSLAGYDHIEGQDFYKKNELLDEKYLKQGEALEAEKKKKEAEKKESAADEGKVQ